jgi:hypothetical protein
MYPNRTHLREQDAMAKDANLTKGIVRRLVVEGNPAVGRDGHLILGKVENDDGPVPGLAVAKARRENDECHPGLGHKFPSM